MCVRDCMCVHVCWSDCMGECHVGVLEFLKMSMITVTRKVKFTNAVSERAEMTCISFTRWR